MADRPPYQPDNVQCPVCGVSCECGHWEEVDIGIGVQTFDEEWECPEHGRFTYVDGKWVGDLIPSGCLWVQDPAASCPRLRLFRPDRGEVGGSYEDGRWYVNDPERLHLTVAQGKATDQTKGIEVMLQVARITGGLS